MQSDRASSSALTVSVVIPAYNSAKHAPRLLETLFAQTYPHDRYEILLVDDGSTDATASVAERAFAQWDGVGRVIRKANGGPASARNAGLRASTADVIAYIDSDCIADADWLTSLVPMLADGAAGVGGPLRNISPPGWVSDYLDACQFFRQRTRNGVVDYLLTANVAFRRDALMQVGGFAERPGVWAEDADLSFRLKQEGYTLLLAPTGTVTHFGSPGTISSLIRELYRYGFGSATLSRSWRNGRTPTTEFIRHGGAAVLAPLLALRLSGRVGFARAMSFWPLITLEHLSFCWGLCMATIQGTAEKGA